MAITAGTLRLTTENRPLPGAMKTAITAPGPVSVASSGSVDGGSVPLELTVAANRVSYWGYAIKAAPAASQPTLANGAIVEGFAGLTQGSLVYVADDGTLTHTAPTVSITETVDSDAGVVAIPLDAIGIAVRTTAIYFFVK